MMTFNRAIELQMGEFDRKVEQLRKITGETPSVTKLAILVSGLDKIIRDIWELNDMKKRAEALVPKITASADQWQTLTGNQVINPGDEFCPTDGRADEWQMCPAGAVGLTPWEYNSTASHPGLFRRRV